MFAPYRNSIGLHDIRTVRTTKDGPLYGWFFITFLLSMTNVNKQMLFNKYDGKFTYNTRVSPNTYCIHLNSTEYLDVSTYKDLEIVKIPKNEIIQKIQMNKIRKIEQEKHILSNISESAQRQLLSSQLASEQELYQKSTKFIVKAIKGWKPKTNSMQSMVYHLAYNYFLVEGVSYDDLYQDDDILLFEPYKEPRNLNTNTISVMQSLQFTNIHKGHTPVNYELHNIGIKGENQIVTIQDTGIDSNHNFFYDSNNQFPINKTNKNHRKVVRYEKYSEGDFAYDNNGHGTHVAGIAAGKCYDDNGVASLYNGHAPEAKIYFSEQGHSDYEHVFNTMEELGSGVFSNSWGNDYYRINTFIFDQLCYEHKNILTVFSAGNEGSYLSVCSPGDSKNIFTVGSVELKETSQTFVLVSENDIKINLGTMDNRLFYQGREKFPQLLQISTSKEPTEGKIYLAAKEEDQCTSYEKCLQRNCSIIVVHPESKSECEQQVPVFAVSQDVYDYLSSNLETKWDVYTSTSIAEPVLSSFSSFGPANNGIIKPDVYAPGSTIISAGASKSETPFTGSTSGETLTLMSGTSMATPALAGEAILLRQYFMECYYPSGKKNESDSFTPSASLMKAAISAGTDSLFTKMQSQHTVTTGIKGLFYSSIATGLALTNHYEDNIKIDPMSSHEYKFSLESEGYIAIAISYLDPPLSDMEIYEEASLLRTAVNLVLELPNGTLQYGNQYSLFFDDLDNIDEIYTTNSVIRLGNAPPGVYKIYVISGPWDKTEFNVEYALAVTGSFEKVSFQKVDSEKEKTCPGKCNGRGECVNGRCVCSDKAAGRACQLDVLDYDIVTNYNFQINGYIWLKKKVEPNKKYQLLIGSNFLDMYNSHYKICVGEEKETVSTDNLFCFYSTYYDQSFGPITFSKDTAYFAIVTTQRKYPLYKFALIEYEEQKIDGKKLINKTEYNTLIAFLVIFLITTIAGGVTIFLLIRKRKENQEEQTSETLKQNIIP